MIEQLLDGLDERNAFLQAVLGLISGAARLDHLLAVYGTPAADAPCTSLAPSDRQGVAFLLGLVAFRNRLHHVLSSLPHAQPSAYAQPAEPLRELLR